MHQLLRCAGIIAISLCLFACGAERRHNTPSNANTQGQPADANGPAQNTNTPQPMVPITPGSGPFAGLALVGLFDTSTPDVLAFDWPNSAIGIRFTGSSLAVNLADDGNFFYNGSPVHSSFDVAVDGKAPTTLQLQANVGHYTLAQNLAAGEHTVWLSKRTEAQVGRSLFSGFVLASDGNRLGTPDLQPRRLLVLGDSESSGYGADANVTRDTMCTFDPNRENANYSWPKLLAHTLRAEVLNMSFSGKGVSRNIVDGDPATLPILYGRTLASDGNSPAPKSWDADVIIIDAGGDDVVGPWGNGTLDAMLFTTNYAGLIMNMRSREPHAKIYAMVGSGPGLNDRVILRDATQSVVQTLNQMGDPDVFYIELPEYDGALGYGCDFHPNRATAAELASQVQQQIAPTVGF